MKQVFQPRAKGFHSAATGHTGAIPANGFASGALPALIRIFLRRAAANPGRIAATVWAAFQVLYDTDFTFDK